MNPGDRIGNYRVVRELGRDGLSVVLLAIDERLERPVALRIVRLAAVFLTDQVEATRDEFRRLARLAARVAHPGLVTVYAFEPLGDTDLIVTEFVEGETLRERIERGYRLSAVEAARIGVQLADALAAAHELGLAHGRINASNILVQLDGRHRILDLGMPKLVLGLGSIRAGDPSDDVAALAGVLVALVTGTDPWEAPTRDGETAGRHPIADEFAARAELGAFAPILRRALRVDGGAGYPDGAAFRVALRAALETAARPTPQAVAAPESSAAAAEIDDEPAPTRLILPIGVDPAARGPAEPPLPWRAVVVAAVFMFVVVVAVFGLRDMLPSQQAPTAPVGSTGQVALQTPPADSGNTVLDGATTEVPAETAAVATTTATAAADDFTASAGSSNGLGSPGVRSAVVDVVPNGAVMRVRGRSGETEHRDGARLTVAEGDSLIVVVARNGYVSQSHVFRGEPLMIRLRPDSIVARFVANVPAEVYLVGPAGTTHLGTTDFDVRMPTGTHRFIFRAPGFDAWQSERSMATPGQTYRVAKTDYPAYGSVLVTVTNGWGYVSLDGGRDRESPVQFDDVTAGRHILRVRRDGFAAIVDTIDVHPGATLRLPYQLRPGG